MMKRHEERRADAYRKIQLGGLVIKAGLSDLPSNVLLDLIRTRKGLKWGVPAMLLAGPYLAIAFWCTTLIENGGPEWLHLVVLVCLWNALKMMAIGPVSVVLLVRARAREYRAQRQEFSEDVPLGELTRSSR